jgi:ATP-binding cassette subfamily B protein
MNTSKKWNISLQRLVGLQMWQYKWHYLTALIALILTHYTQSQVPFAAKYFVEHVGQESGVQWSLVLRFFLLVVGIIIFRTASRYYFFLPARLIQKGMRTDFIKSIENAHPSRYQKYSDGQLMQLLSGDIDQIRAFLGFALLNAGNIIVAMVVLLPQLYIFDSTLMYCLAPILGSFFFYFITVSRMAPFFKLGAKQRGELQDAVIESYQGQTTIKNYQAQKNFVTWFAEMSGRELDTFYKTSRTISYASPLTPLGIGLSLILGAYVIQSKNLGASSLVFYTGFIFLFLEPFLFLSWIGIITSQAVASWKRIVELLTDLESGTKGECIVSQLPMKEQAWQVLVGPTGGGKTWRMMQLCSELLRAGKNISYVAQAPYVYNETVEKNIFLGKEPSDEEKKEAQNILKLFGMDEIQGSAVDIFAVEVGENGKRLSGGQAKRLCLVRSLMSGADYFLWDDPFSAVDVIWERKIIDWIQSKFKNKTFVVTSHRFTTVKAVSEIYFVEKDQITSFKLADAENKTGKLYEFFQEQMV